MVTDTAKSDSIRKLTDEQLGDFDREYMNPRMFNALCEWIQHQKSLKNSFDFLDVGGGNGVFADKMLAAYPEATGTVLDNSELLLQRNKPHARKALELRSAEFVDGLDHSFDLIFFNFVLHHFVVGGYLETRRRQIDILRKAASRLKPDGHIVFLECMPQGMISDTLCSFLINRITSSRLLASFVRSAGANTGGIGVCFLGKYQWQRTVREAGLETSHYQYFGTWGESIRLFRLKKLCLTMKSISNAFFFVRIERDACGAHSDAM
ncbi:methyltransferase [Stieleria sp. ICT_E10.1]|uniref:class I SAM-dependent methyltransferase n=1 Tax=Stieleria sedimenti TaxID=2976331 RepID=UPI00217FF9FE|nr:class I SAM-dependent methyltransferase [Stieleria sedimenti]MCS7466749.1 methyltransferase [Stieleria sedimenti]